MAPNLRIPCLPKLRPELPTTISNMIPRRYWHLSKWRVWSPSRDPLPLEPLKHWRISLCTSCMGRAHDLAATLPANLAANSNYGNLEFVVLDYNSRDGLDSLLRSEELRPYIASGRLRCLRTRLPRFFEMSRSRNISFLNATGDILINVDADNFTGEGFAACVNRLGNLREHKVIFAKGKRRINGRIGIFRSDFIQLGGYDEDFIGYGSEDYSLLLRAINSGFTLMWWAKYSRRFMERLETPRYLVGANLQYSDWKQTEAHNKRLLMEKLARNEHVANQGSNWGRIKDLELLHSDFRWRSTSETQPECL